jgi:glycosyltransferase involved in cell wall biosynthesis
MSVVPLGINLEGYDRPDPGSGIRDPRGSGVPCVVGYFARVAPEKGLHVLADAYVRLRRRASALPMRLEAAGYLPRDGQPYLDSVRRTIDAAGLGAEFTYRGEVDRAGKQAFLRGLDVLSVPATYDEPKGMFLLEAMASGVPVVQPRRGSFTEIVERTGGGLLVEPDDPAPLAEGLYTLWTNRSLRDTLAQRAFEGVRAHYSIAQAADRLLEVCGAVLKSGRALNESVA